MKNDKCKLCGYEDDVDYLRLIYSGHSSHNIFSLICENCHSKIFSDRERSKREDCNCPNRYLLNGEYAGKYCRCGALNSMET